MRSTKKERLDTGDYTEKEYFHCLKQLDRIGRWIGAEKATLSAFPQNPTSILDIGCGGGGFTARIAKHFPKAQVVGSDINPLAIAYAKKHYTLPNLSFHSSEEKNRFDVVTMTLVCHHLTDEELIPFFEQMLSLAKKRIVINDLRRTPLASLSFALTAPLFFPSKLIFEDGLLSIKRAFTLEDWKRVLPNANSWNIERHFPFRYIVTKEI